MDMIKFAMLIAYVGNLVRRADELGLYEVQELHRLAQDCLKVDDGNVRVFDVINMLQFMHANKRIDAIKLCRQMTGYGLKEAKDLIEQAMSPIPSQHY